MSLTTRINLSAVIVLLSFICLAAFALERAFFESTESALHDTMSSQLFALMGQRLKLKINALLCLQMSWMHY
jgi:hypothetical protein